MAKYSIGCRFHDLQYFEVDFFVIFLEFIINLMEPLQKDCRKNIHLMYIFQGLSKF